MESKIEDLIKAVPDEPDFIIGWDYIINTVIKPYYDALKNTPQNPVHHAEGDVWEHTKMVCEKLVKYPEFRALPTKNREELFIAALFHDIGKIKTTRIENGDITSPHHALVGSSMVRNLLYMEYEIGGTAELQNFRETICLLIRYHMIAPYVLEDNDPDRKLIRTAANGELVPDFSLNELFILSRADAEGRISADNNKSAGNSLLALEAAKDAGCAVSPLMFASAFTEFAYLSGRNVTPCAELYNDTVCNVIMMCGLPGVGKDTYIKKNYSEYPVISLDEIRKEFGVFPTDDQNEVARIGRERAKQLLRQKQSFVWNATCFTPDMRMSLFSLFNRYHAYVKIVFLETDYETNLKRNRSREATVPENVIEDMRSKLMPPERYEAHEVIWECV